jgi:hypothetical protein
LFDQELNRDSRDPISARAIPHSVVRLTKGSPTAELVSGLLATRSQRALQTVDFGRIGGSKTAALVAELVSTDPSKQWRLSASFGEKAASAFCSAVTAAYHSSHRSSLIGLTAQAGPEQAFATVLAAVPTITCLDLWVRNASLSLRSGHLTLNTLTFSFRSSQRQGSEENDRLPALVTSILSERQNLHTLVCNMSPSRSFRRAVRQNHSVIVCEGWVGHRLLFNRVSASELLCMSFQIR